MLQNGRLTCSGFSTAGQVDISMKIVIDILKRINEMGKLEGDQHFPRINELLTDVVAFRLSGA